MPGIFITATDTGVGKTVSTLVLATLLKNKGCSVGVFKPVQCAGNDAAFLKKHLTLDDSLQTINPFFAREPLSPHLAFRREKKKINIKMIRQSYALLLKKYDIVLIEGAGGLQVPLCDNYFVSDLIRDLNVPLIVVARLGLGTINHTSLTVEHARSKGLNVLGVLFNESKKSKRGVAEKTNPESIAKNCGVPILGTISYLKDFDKRTIQQICGKKINFKDFIARGVLQYASTKELIQWDKKYVWHPFTQMKDWFETDPLVIDRAHGSYLIDANGNKYLDGVSSLWVNVHGHRKSEIDQAVKNQIDKISHSTLLGLANTPSIELAKKLIKIAPKGLARVFYSDNGSTAVEVAIKMAYQYWQNKGFRKKVKIAHLENSYHGDTLGSVSVGGIDLFHKVYRKLRFQTIQVNFSILGAHPKFAFEYVDRFEAMVKKNHDSIAAFVVEPLVQGAAGMIVWPKGVLRRFADICKKYDIVFIVDEVATGFGRTGKMFACEHENVTPDILCLAKGITGGYLPLAATLTTQKIFDGFVFPYEAQKTFFHGHTYTGNPLACAAALANLEIFEKEQTLRHLQPKIKFLANRLKMFYNLASVGEVRQKGFMVGIELVKDRKTMTQFDWKERVGIKVCQKARERGVILRPLGNVIVLMPPLSISLQELDELLNVTYWAVEQTIKI